MKYIFTSLFFLFFSNALFSQTGNNITKAWAFYISNVGGAPMATEEGNATQPLPTLQIYVKLKKPIVTVFNIYLQNGVGYQAIARKTTEYPLKLADGEVIMTDKQDYIYELILNNIVKKTFPTKIKTALLNNSLIISYFANKNLNTFSVKNIVNKNINLL